jgi:hypothetical protein
LKDMLHIKNTVTPTFQHFDAIVKAFDKTARMPFEKIIGDFIEPMMK